MIQQHIEVPSCRWLATSAWTIWITGLPGSGKSTIARRLHLKLQRYGVRSFVLSTDQLRKVMTPKPTYSEEERERVYAVIVYIAKILNLVGVNVILDATGNLKKYRDYARKELRRLFLVYARCPIEVCMIREKGRRQTFGAPREIYQKGINGRSRTVPGINVPYEEPDDADVVIETATMSASECADKIIQKLGRQLL
jgi:adenylylsulfate kinase